MVSDLEDKIAEYEKRLKMLITEIDRNKAEVKKFLL